MSTIGELIHYKEHYERTINKARFNNFWGYELALPITFHPKAFKRWDIQAQPYLLQLHANNTNPIYGLRVLAGYNF